jgi:hypothetical protein
MHLDSTIRSFFLVIAALGLLTLTTELRPAAASGSTLRGPIAGPVEVFTEAEVLSAPFGELLETTLLAENHADAPVRVLLIGRITWPDGSTQILRYGPPTTIDADGALLINALSPIPADVGSGEGTFTATAFVGPIGHGGRRDYPGPLIPRDSSTFVIP